MIKKILFLALTTFFYSFASGQIVFPYETDCIQNFTLEAKTIQGNNQRVDDIIITWDFSETSNIQNLELTFQIQPLNACWEGLEGTNRSEARTIKITNFSEHITGSQKLEYNDLNCKCIKWKAIIVDPTTNCETKTDWQFTSFL
jgi:hypothetical protein